MNELKEGLQVLAEMLTEIGEALKEALCIMGEKLKEIRDEIFEARVEMFNPRADNKNKREAALLAGQRGAARAKAYGLRMQLEKARRAMRRRKRLHNDGGLPDW